MKLMKQLSKILLIISMVATLSGCNSSNNSTESTDTSSDNVKQSETSENQTSENKDFKKYDALSFDEAEIEKLTENDYGDKENIVKIKIKATNKSDKTIRKIMSNVFIYDKDGKTIIDSCNGDYIEGSIEPNHSIYIYVDFNSFNDKENVFKNIDKAVISEYSYYVGDDSVTVDPKSKTYALNYTTY